MRIFTRPDGAAEELSAGRAARLKAAHEGGARFLAVPVTDNLDAAAWALACFHSPVAFVPLPGNLPASVLAARIAQLPAGEVIFPEQVPQANEKESRLRSGHEVWAVIFSSGTSGEPKGVALTGANFEASARAHAAHSGAGNACWLLDLPLYHVGGLSVLTRALFLEAPIAISTSPTAEWVRSGKVQGLSLVPTTLVRLLREEVPFQNLSIILLGGAPATPELETQARGRGAPVRLTYGMTEHASQIATEKTKGLEPLPGVELRIDDGEILVRSPMLARGYYESEQLKPLPMRAGFFATGDLGEIVDGKLIIRGRRSELIISGGKKVYPVEVEAAIARLPGVVDCAVAGAPHAEWGEEVVALVAGTFDEAQVRTALKAALEAHKVPKRFLKVESIPRSPAGKVLRPALRGLIQS